MVLSEEEKERRRNQMAKVRAAKAQKKEPKSKYKEIVETAMLSEESDPDHEIQYKPKKSTREQIKDEYGVKIDQILAELKNINKHKKEVTKTKAKSSIKDRKKNIHKQHNDTDESENESPIPIKEMKEKQSDEESDEETDFVEKAKKLVGSGREFKVYQPVNVKKMHLPKMTKKQQISKQQVSKQKMAVQSESESGSESGSYTDGSESDDPNDFVAQYKKKIATSKKR